MNTDILWALAFSLGMLGSGFFSSLRVKNFEDYSVAGQNMNFLLLFTTLTCTVVGGATTMGFVGLVRHIGLNFLWIVAAIVLSNIFSGWFLAAPIRKLQIKSVGELYGHFYGDSTMCFANVVAFFTTILLFGVQLTGMGNILSILTGWSLRNCIIFSSAIMLLYTWAGGIRAVARTDFLQFLFICAGLGCTIFIGFQHLHGMNGLYKALLSVKPASLAICGNMPAPALLGLFLTFFLGGILSPSMVQRYASSKSEKQAKQGVLLFAAFFLFFGLVIIALGLMVIALPDLPLREQEKELITLMRFLLPDWLYGLGIAAIFAAVMSTADSFLNTSSIIFVKTLRQKNASERSLLLSARISTLLIGVAGVVVALVKPEILGLVKYAFAIWAPCMLPAMVPLLLKKEPMTRQLPAFAANCSMATGMIAMILFQGFAIKTVFHLPVILVGMILSSAVLFIFSRKSQTA